MVTGIPTVATGILTVVTDREPIQPDVGRVNLSVFIFLIFLCMYFASEYQFILCLPYFCTF